MSARVIARAMISRDEIPTLAARIAARAVLLPNGCHAWCGALNSTGYPTIKYKGRCYLATRVVLAHALGRWLAPRAVAMHSCDVPQCVNPAHLSEGDYRQNLKDAWARRRRTRPCTLQEGV